MAIIILDFKNIVRSLTEVFIAIFGNSDTSNYPAFSRYDIICKQNKSIKSYEDSRLAWKRFVEIAHMEQKKKKIVKNIDYSDKAKAYVKEFFENSSLSKDWENEVKFMNEANVAVKRGKTIDAAKDEYHKKEIKMINSGSGFNKADKDFSEWLTHKASTYTDDDVKFIQGKYD